MSSKIVYSIRNIINACMPDPTVKREGSPNHINTFFFLTHFLILSLPFIPLDIFNNFNRYCSSLSFSSFMSLISNISWFWMFWFLEVTPLLIVEPNMLHSIFLSIKMDDLLRMYCPQLLPTSSFVTRELFISYLF